MSFVTKLNRQTTKPETGPHQQGVAAVGPQSLARGLQSLAQGRPGGEMGVDAQCVGHPTILLPEWGGSNFVKQLKKTEAYTKSLTPSQGQGVATGMEQLDAGAQLGAAGPVGGNLVRLIKHEKLEPVGEAATTGVRSHDGLRSWSDMQQGGKRKLSDHLHGGSHSKRHRAQSDSDSDSDGSCSSQLGAEQETLLSELLEDSAPDSTLGQDRSHWKTWVAACAEAGISPTVTRSKTLRSTSQRRKEMRKLAYVVWVVHKNMLPRRKRDPAAKPVSAYQVYLGVRRIHERRGFQMVDSHMTVMMVKAMNNGEIPPPGCHGRAALLQSRNANRQEFVLGRK